LLDDYQSRILLLNNYAAMETIYLSLVLYNGGLKL